MAIFTSLGKCFEITAISFTPDKIAFGEEVSYSITVKNISGKKISSMYADIKLYYRDASGAMRSSWSEYIYGGPAFAFKAISWAANASKTFTGTFKVGGSYEPSKADRLIPIYVGSDAGYTNAPSEPLGLMFGFTTDAIFSSGGNSDQFYNIRGGNSEYLKVYDARYVPSIPKFVVERSTGDVLNDEGENAIAGIRLALKDSTYYNHLSLQLRYRDKAVGGEYASEDLSLLMQHALSAEIATVILKTFSKNSDWELLLWYGDEFESVTASFVLSRAFANVHLSGASTGGVCFGSFSKATEDNPSFQCYYPAMFYAGIEGGFSYQSDEFDTGGRWIDGRRIYRRVIEINVSTLNTRVEMDVLPETAAMVNIFGYVTRASGSARYPMTFWYSTTNYHSIWMETATALAIKTSHAIVGYVVIEYTKSSDVAST